VAGWIGAAHPTFVPELAEEIEIGWALRRPFWGRGLASEGAAAAVPTAFAHLSPARVISLIDARNERSIAVARRLGMGHVRDVLHPATRAGLRVYALSGEGAATRGGPGARPAA
jgi:RimJ/RimL family protein N-acetyltransferase